MKPSISVFFPCYNDAGTISAMVIRALQTVRELTDDYEVIVVNDESTDQSKSLIERFIAGKENVALLDIPHGGKPAAIWAGILQAAGDVVLLTDMDQSTPIAELSKLLPWCEQGFDVVIGSRYVTGGSTSGCVRATVVDSLQHGYRTIVPEEYACVPVVLIRRPHSLTIVRYRRGNLDAGIRKKWRPTEFFCPIDGIDRVGCGCAIDLVQTRSKTELGWQMHGSPGPLQRCLRAGQNCG